MVILQTGVILKVTFNKNEHISRKKAYFEHVKLANFRKSSRFEGLTFSTDQSPVPSTPQAIEQAGQTIINCYK